jgi:ABC-type Zn uptake system ZnuABC Zn-binding protein ZnuA
MSELCVEKLDKLSSLIKEKNKIKDKIDEIGGIDKISYGFNGSVFDEKIIYDIYNNAKFFQDIRNVLCQYYKSELEKCDKEISSLKKQLNIGDINDEY